MTANTQQNVGFSRLRGAGAGLSIGYDKSSGPTGVEHLPGQRSLTYESE